jgi:hypothetical protein
MKFFTSILLIALTFVSLQAWGSDDKQINTSIMQNSEFLTRANDDDTDSAFGALLSMPGVQPVEGGWQIPDNYLQAFANEDELITHLSNLNADFNAIRHRGTLLTHAIRAGKEQTAIWLLRNGADIKRANTITYGTSDTYVYDNTTAYELARKYKRSTVIKELESNYGFKPPVPKPTALPIVSTISKPKTNVSRVDQGIDLIRRLVTTSYTDKVAQKSWQDFAATLSAEEYVTLFNDEDRLNKLILLVRDTDGGLENALSRLPIDFVRKNAQLIADRVAEWSYVKFYDNPRISYTAASQSWPALWSRIEQPLNYDKTPELAGHIPPILWPMLFTSGYQKSSLNITGCLASALDPNSFKSIWPNMQQFFPDARKQILDLVLRRYMLTQDEDPCYYSSSDSETLAKLSFLREQGITGTVEGLSNFKLADTSQATKEVITNMRSTNPIKPRLVTDKPICSLVMGDMWLNALIKTSADYVQVIDIPGKQECGLLLSRETWYDFMRYQDNFDGPWAPGFPSCPSYNDGGAILFSENGEIREQEIETRMDDDGQDFYFNLVKDNLTGKRYLLNTGRSGASCIFRWNIPDTYEWKSSNKGIELRRSADSEMLEGLLRAQCEDINEGEPLHCHGIEFQEAMHIDTEAKASYVMDTLRAGHRINFTAIVDALGTVRRREYLTSIIALDRKQHDVLLATGIPARWTDHAIRSIGVADITLEEKRRRIALVFTNSAQLESALYGDKYMLPKTLLTWLPRQEWGPVLQVIESNPDQWRDAAISLREEAENAGRSDLACDIDHAQGFLCGGGINLEALN